MFEYVCKSCHKVRKFKGNLNIGDMCRSCSAKKRIKKHGNPMLGKQHADLTKFRPEYTNVNYNDFIIYTTPAGKNKRKYKMTCLECSADRGYLIHNEAKRTCLSCHTKRYTKKNPIQKRIYNSMKANISQRFRWRKIQKDAGIFRHLPYTIDQLVKHLENQFESWMTWDNYGAFSKDKITWQIDHIIPDSSLSYLSVVDEGFKLSWALSNLRPLESMENILKSDTI